MLGGVKLRQGREGRAGGDPILRPALSSVMMDHLQ